MSKNGKKKLHKNRKAHILQYFLVTLITNLADFLEAVLEIILITKHLSRNFVKRALRRKLEKDARKPYDIFIKRNIVPERFEFNDKRC